LVRRLVAAVRIGAESVVVAVDAPLPLLRIPADIALLGFSIEAAFLVLEAELSHRFTQALVVLLSSPVRRHPDEIPDVGAVNLPVEALGDVSEKFEPGIGDLPLCLLLSRRRPQLRVEPDARARRLSRRRLRPELIAVASERVDVEAGDRDRPE